MAKLDDTRVADVGGPPEIVSVMYMKDGENIDGIEELKLEYDNDDMLTGMDIDNFKKELALSEDDTLWVFYYFHGVEYSRKMKVNELQSMVDPYGITRCVEDPKRVKVIDVTLNVNYPDNGNDTNSKNGTDNESDSDEETEWDVKLPLINILGPGQNYHKSYPTLGDFIDMLKNNFEYLELPDGDDLTWDLTITKIDKQIVISNLEEKLRWTE